MPCPHCNCTSPYYDGRRPNFDELLYNRCGEIVNENGTIFTVALKNNCDGTVRQLGAVNFVTVILLLIATTLLGGYLHRQEVQFDEDEQTAQDYSIRITNPPNDATDPEEWRRFFLENCDGAQVTVWLLDGSVWLILLRSRLICYLFVRRCVPLLSTMIFWYVHS